MSLDRLRRQHLYYEQEILMTRKLAFGYPDVTTPEPGVVSGDDPASHMPGGSDPLAVSVNATNQNTVDVNPGVAVFLSGVFLELHDTVRQVALADQSVGVPNVVYLEYHLADATLQLNDYTETPSPYTMRIGEDADSLQTDDILINSITVDNWNSLPATSKEDLVPLAVVTMESVYDATTGTTVNSLSIDHTRASYAWNRPWFSVVDLAHRLKVGSGTVTDSNPHGQSFQDGTVGDFSLLELLLDHGMVVGDDKTIPKVPGYRCTSTLTNILTDDASGTFTGIANAQYVALPYFPVRVGRTWDAVSGETLAGEHVPQTNLVVFPTADPVAAGTSISVYYTRVQAAEPPLPNATTFTTVGPTTGELIVAGGLAKTALSTTEETFSDAYQFPMRYDMFVDGDGTLLKTPQVVYCYKKLDDIGTSDVPTITQYGPAYLMVGLLNATDVPTMEVKIRIYGTDVNGTAINNLVTFTGPAWQDPGPVPNTTLEQKAVQIPTDLFASITNIVIEGRTDDGPDSAIMIWALIKPQTVTEMDDACHVAHVLWDGLRLARIYDKRIVATTVRDQMTSTLEIGNAISLVTVAAGGNQTVYVEDLRQPRYHSLNYATQYGDDLEQYQPWYDLHKWQVGCNGTYESRAFPVNTLSGTTWRVTLLGAVNTPDALVENQPTLGYWDGATWSDGTMAAVAGVPNTWEVTLAAVPIRVRVDLGPTQAVGYILYG